MFYPVQADVPPDRTRLLYFDSEESQNEGLHFLLAEQGYDSQLDQYDLISKLGDGAFSQVMMAQHRASQEKFAMKVIPINVYNERHRAQVTREINLQ